MAKRITVYRLSTRTDEPELIRLPSAKLELLFPRRVPAVQKKTNLNYAGGYMMEKRAVVESEAEKTARERVKDHSKKVETETKKPSAPGGSGGTPTEG